MVTVAAGRFQYFTWQKGQYSNREHVEWATVDRSFAIGKYEVTRSDFEIFVDRARYRTEARRDPEYGCESYRIVIVRMRWHQPTIDYARRRTAEGLSKRDIIRCLKRFVAREIYHALLDDHRVGAACAEAA